MDLDPQTRDGAIILSPQGRIDQNTAPQFQEALLSEVTKASAVTVVIDMSDVGFMSSVGLRALMMAYKQSMSSGGNLVIADLSPVVKEVFQISRFDTVLNCFDNVQAALANSG